MVPYAQAQMYQPQQQQYPQSYQPYPPQPYPQPYPQTAVYVNNVQHTTAVIMKAPFNHTVHIVLDVVTCGGWIPIHLICWIAH